jgi:hypothetical protein
MLRQKFGTSRLGHVKSGPIGSAAMLSHDDLDILVKCDQEPQQPFH